MSALSGHGGPDASARNSLSDRALCPVRRHVGLFHPDALNGERGLKTKDEYKRQIYALRDDLARLKEDSAHWQHRVTLMRADALDRDLSEEQARLKLDYVDPRDLVIFIDANRQR